jgi:PAS domain S-box-containing protein
VIRRRPEVAALAALLALYASWLALSWIPGDPQKLQILFLAPIDALVVYACWRASRRPEQTPWLRAFWLFVMFGWVAELGADLILAVYDIGLEDPTFPSFADLLFLTFYPLLMVALLRVPTLRGSRAQRLRTGLDCATVVVGAGAVIWYFVLGPTVTEGGGSLLETAVSIAYPVGDIVLLGALALVLVRGSPQALRLPLRLLAVGLLALIAADTIYGHQQLHGTYSPGDPVDSLYVLMAVPFILAAAGQRRVRRGEAGARAEARIDARSRVSRLPLMAMAVGLAVLLGTQWHDKFFPDLSLLIFVLVLSALSVARQYVAQTELVQLRDRLRVIVESVADGIVTFSERGRIIWVNPAAEEAFQVEAGGLEGEPVDALFHGVTWKEMAPLLGVGAGAGATVIGERRTLTGERRNGETFPLEMVVTDARLDGERVLIAIGRDVGERERSAAALRESERRFRGIFDHAGVGIAFSAFEDGVPRIVDVNAAFSRTVGYSLDELRGDDFSLITHPDDLAGLAEMGEAVAAGDDYIAREMRCARKDGSLIWGSLTVSILRDEEGVPLFAVGMLEDVSSRKEAERLKDEFVSVVGHELRTPLTSIRGSLGLLAGGVMGELPEEAMGMLGTAISSTDRLVRLINDILDIERMDSGRAEIEVASVSASELVELSTQVVAGVATEADIVLRTEIDDTAIVCDADKIVQVLTNLLGNAIKFSPSGSTVDVTVASVGSDALFSVSDAGRGIPAEKIESIFERFSQVDSSDAREKGGTGLGLAIARRIVERHGGRIWAESSEGAGSTFHFTLPLEPQPAIVMPAGKEAHGAPPVAR